MLKYMFHCVCGKAYKRSKNAEKHFMQCRIKYLTEQLEKLQKEHSPKKPKINPDSSWIKK